MERLQKAFRFKINACLVERQRFARQKQSPSLRDMPAADDLGRFVLIHVELTQAVECDDSVFDSKGKPRFF